MDDKDIRQAGYPYPCPCTLGAETGPQTIVVRQVIAEQEAQLVLDIHVVVPDTKPAIEQIVDVFVKDVEINKHTIYMIELLTPEPVDVGTDDKGVYEQVIEVKFYYERM